ncbi:MAG: Hsp70 family protein, partial [Janthinobacterium lividum]
MPEDALVLVCDWGAHTFECSVQQHVGGGWREIGAPDGVERLGGADVDEALFTLLDLRCAGALTRLRGGNEKERQLAAEVLDRCREGKEALSAVPATVVEVPLPGELHRELVTRSDVEGITEPLLEPALAAVARCLQSAGISAGDLHTVVLVGGSGQAPVLTRMLTRALERPVHLPSRPGAETALAAAEWGPACPESAGVEAPALQRDVVTLPPEEDDHAGKFEEDPPRLVELVVAGAGPHTATGSVAAFPSQVHVAPTGLPTSRDGSTRWEDHGERPRSAPQEPTDPARSADPSRSTDTDYHPDPAQPAHSAHPRDSAHPSTAGHPSSAGHSRTAGRPGGSTPARQQVRRALPHPRNWSRPLLTSLVVGVVAVSATALVLAAALHGDDRTRTTAADPGSTPAGTVLRRARTVNPTPPTPLPTVTAVTTGNSLSPATPAAPLTLPVSTLPTGQVQLCAQGNYSAYLLIPQPASGGVAMPSVASPVVAPGQCWMAQVPTGGQSVQISLFARRGDG